MSKSIIGLNSLNEKLTHLSANLSNKEITPIIKEGLEIVRADAKLLVHRNHGELVGSIQQQVKETQSGLQGIVYTNKSYAKYVEFGTGPKGQKDHDGISPVVNVTYSQHGWGIPADKVSREDALKYKWPKRKYNKKEYYMTSGQPAYPFMYPALKNNENRIKKTVEKEISKKIRKVIE